MQKSWLQFDLSGLSNGTIIEKAILTLFSHDIPHTFNYGTNSSIKSHNLTKRSPSPHFREFRYTAQNIAELSRMKTKVGKPNFTILIFHKV
jgi:hypothetical protein